MHSMGYRILNRNGQFMRRSKNSKIIVNFVFFFQDNCEIVSGFKQMPKQKLPFFFRQNFSFVFDFILCESRKEWFLFVCLICLRRLLC